MKKLTLALTILILSLPFFSLNVKAEILGDPNDILTVVTPSANQKVSGSVNITWYMFDNNQNVIPYKINLYDSSTCRTTNFGQINSANTGISSTTQLNSYTWNTRSTLSTANLADGNYCLKICLAMKNGSGNYSACNARYVRIINNNRAPRITSVPSNLIIKESASWQYQIVATDPDNDPITYRLVFGTPFLTINQQTGLVSTTTASKLLPPGVTRADYNIVVSADDNFAGAVNQQFVLTIIKDSSIGVPPPVTTPVSTPGGTIYNQPSTINFLTPKEGQIFSGAENKISWQASDVDGIESLTINYSKDSTDWKLITKFDGNSIPSEYNWDVSSIEDSNYYLQIILKDKLGNEVYRSSKKFEINNKTTGPGQENNPLIINVKPQNNSEVIERRPVISGDFIPADESEINGTTFSIRLNGQESLLDCQNDNEKFSCTPNRDLSDGLHKVVASVEDSLEREVTIEWSFTVRSDTPISTPVGSGSEDVIPIFGREIPRNIFNILLIICCIAGLLLLIPWILYLLWSGRRQDEETVETTTTTYDFDAPIQETTEASPVYTSTTFVPQESSNYYTPENYSYSNTATPIDTTTETTTTTSIDETPVLETKSEATTDYTTDSSGVVEAKTEVKTDTTPLVTNDTNIDDYYSYVNPSGTVPTATESKTTTETTYVEPTETS